MNEKVYKNLITLVKFKYYAVILIGDKNENRRNSGEFCFEGSK